MFGNSRDSALWTRPGDHEGGDWRLVQGTAHSLANPSIRAREGKPRHGNWAHASVSTMPSDVYALVVSRCGTPYRWLWLELVTRFLGVEYGKGDRCHCL